MNTLNIVLNIAANILSISLSLAAIWHVRKVIKLHAKEALRKAEAEAAAAVANLDRTLEKISAESQAAIQKQMDQ